MARKQNEPIRTEAFVIIDGQTKSLDKLDPQKRNEISAVLKTTWLNSIYMGNVVFQTHAEEKSTHLNHGKENTL